MKILHQKIFPLLIVLIVSQFLVGQTTEGKTTVAVLEFEGRGINQMEAATLTDRMMSELVNTNAVIMVERNQMDEILSEQGFQQSGCTSSECAAEVGALLGVQNMVSGAFGKLGNSYTIDAKMFSVETGATVRAVTKTYKGEVDGLLNVISVVAWELVGLTPPAELLARIGEGQDVAKVKQPRQPMSKGMKRFLWTAVLLGGGGYGAYAAGLFDPAPVPLPEPPTFPGE